MSALIFSKEGMLTMPALPPAWMYAMWTYAYHAGQWYWVSIDKKINYFGDQDWNPVRTDWVPKEFRAQALIMG